MSKRTCRNQEAAASLLVNSILQIAGHVVAVGVVLPYNSNAVSIGKVHAFGESGYERQKFIRRAGGFAADVFERLSHGAGRRRCDE